MRVEIEEGLSKPNGKWCSDLISKSFVRIGSCTLHMWLLQARCWCAGMSWCISAWVRSNECSSSRNYWIVQFCVEFQRENAVQKSILEIPFLLLYILMRIPWNFSSISFNQFTQMQLPYPFNLITLHFITIQSTKIVMKKNAISIGDNHVLHLLWRCQNDSLTYLFGVFTRSQNKCHCLASASSFHAHIIAALHCEKFDCIELKSRASADLRCAVLTWPQST